MRTSLKEKVHNCYQLTLKHFLLTIIIHKNASKKLRIKVKSYFRSTFCSLDCTMSPRTDTREDSPCGHSTSPHTSYHPYTLVLSD